MCSSDLCLIDQAAHPSLQDAARILDCPVLTFRHRNYPFTVHGLSLGFTAGASVNKLVGRAEHINELRDFTGAYSVIGAGVALFGGVGGVQLKNSKGVIITLHGAKAGVEVSANVTTVVITLDPSRSTPN